MNQFFNMGGYGFYIWMSYGIGFSLLGLQVFSTIWKSRHANVQQQA